MNQGGYAKAKKKASLPLSVIILVTLGFLAVEIEWAILYVFANPLLRELGASYVVMGLAWFASPVCIMIFQPIIGVYSDRSTHRWGRRRPFLLAASSILFLAMLLLPNAGAIAEALAPPEHAKPTAIFLAMLGVMLIDFMNELVYYLLRALLVDTLPQHQSELGNSVCSFMMSMGGLAGNLIGSFDYTSLFPFLASNIQTAYNVSLFITFASFSVTFCLAKEVPLRAKKIKEIRVHPLVELWNFVRKMPPGLLRLCFADFFAWTALFSFFMYSTEWVGENVFGGSPDESNPLLFAKFQAGVRQGALDLAATNVVALVAAALLPHMVRRVGLKQVYSSVHVFLAAVLCLSVFTHSSFGAVVVIACVGIPFAVDESLPYVYVSRMSGDRNTGLHLAVLQNFAVCSKMLISIGMGSVVTLAAGNISAVFVTGAVSALIAAFLMKDLPNFEPTAAEFI
eukprot:TRINITY_DN5660_c0_g1_i1.p1 TRINITY_DN5660_c0_g1~~TRINITY_DN5660_c0_g1_i1.p1  ORF type:complete len:525 (-),score=137.49 TRINITY_DN5660_c0_g1_i1:54-1415(-)